MILWNFQQPETTGWLLPTALLAREKFSGSEDKKLMSLVVLSRVRQLKKVWRM